MPRSGWPTNWPVSAAVKWQWRAAPACSFDRTGGRTQQRMRSFPILLGLGRIQFIGLTVDEQIPGATRTGSAARLRGQGADLEADGIEDPVVGIEQAQVVPARLR